MGPIEKIRAHEMPAFQLVPSADAVASKIGGLPNLPATIPWPEWRDRPLAFICQIDVGEAPKQEGFDDPLKTGMLFFFYDQEQSTWGFDPDDRGSWRVIYTRDEIPDTPAEAPAGLEDDFIYDEQLVAFKAIISRPSGERIGLDFAAMSDDEYDQCEAFLEAPYGELPKHQVGGFPFVLQNDSMELDSQLASNGLYLGDATGYEDPRAEALAKGAGEWVLLLQIDTDDGTGMMWGDCGLLYFWIKRDDFLKAHFDDVWMILQCG